MKPKPTTPLKDNRVKEKHKIIEYCSCAWQPNETSPAWLGKEIPKYCANCLRLYFFVRFDK